MRLPVVLRPDAETDIQNTHDSLESVRGGLGKQFVARVREVLERIEAFPKLFSVVWREVRAVRIKQFRYVIYYVVFEDRVDVLGVVHGSRESAAWKSRLS